MADKNLSLGTIFTGHVDQAFRTATKELLAITKNLSTSMNKLNVAFRSASRRAAVYKQKVDRAVQSTGRLGEKADFAGRQINKVRGAWERFTAALKVTVAYGIAATMIYKLVQGLQAGVTEIIDFDQALKNLQAITMTQVLKSTLWGRLLKM